MLIKIENIFFSYYTSTGGISKSSPEIGIFDEPLPTKYLVMYPLKLISVTRTYYNANLSVKNQPVNLLITIIMSLSSNKISKIKAAGLQLDGCSLASGLLKSVVPQATYIVPFLQ